MNRPGPLDTLITIISPAVFMAYVLYWGALVVIGVVSSVISAILTVIILGVYVLVFAIFTGLSQLYRRAK